MTNEVKKIVSILDSLCSGKKNEEAEKKQIRVISKDGKTCFSAWNHYTCIHIQTDGELQKDSTLTVVNTQVLLNALEKSVTDIGSLGKEEPKKVPMLKSPYHFHMINVMGKDLGKAMKRAYENQMPNSVQRITRDTNLEFSEGGLYVSGTTGYRLCRSYVEAVSVDDAPTGQFFIHGPCVKAISAALELANEVSVSVCNGTLSIYGENVIILTRVQEGEFLDCRKALKGDFDYSITYNRKQFYKAFQKVCKGQGYKINIMILLSRGLLQGPQVGQEIEVLDCDGFEPVGVRANILEDGIANIEGSDIMIRVTKGGLVVISSPFSDDVVYMTTKMLI